MDSASHLALKVKCFHYDIIDVIMRSWLFNSQFETFQRRFATS